MKREVFLSQLVESMSLSLNHLEETMKNNDLEKFQIIKNEIIKLKEEIGKELEKWKKFILNF